MRQLLPLSQRTTDGQRIAICGSVKIENPLLLIARGQGVTVLELLNTFLHTLTNTPWNVPFLHTNDEAASVFPLSEEINAQLKYDPKRLSIISYLYGMCCTFNAVTDILLPFTESAATVPYEPYYPGAEPDQKGNCHCGQPRPWRAKMHLLRCARKHKIALAEANFVQVEPFQCLWKSCSSATWNTEPVALPPGNAMKAVMHVTEHVSSAESHCLWDGCRTPVRNVIELHRHLEEAHNVFTTLTVPTKAHFCIECKQWKESDLDWYMHAVHHTTAPGKLCGQVTVNGILAAPGRCPYCMKDGIYTQFDHTQTFLRHVQRHITAAEATSTSLTCPHPSCETGELDTRTIKRHIEDVHGIRLSAL
ncbi:uncharacterized protein EI97DRAFT_224475 [Westerdykella ornata]|uniref:C2H2-type domain-containing protein n=1 Tax=Westerdykella ornata TaxID=318751 RepID=A0A6A6JVA1_WESOR|nr:uncharacterized protein EI97DRAFT_224475 [Westerdykella ornata]KAF2278969.1 hypothetical protein EI97DRAFT_224475 [Westerdykella ornata]